ncbi:hypothetical protein ACFWXK_17290 [Streptomyces sp. NPDC059070]|uniref:hypothetical protein n=1 Tax=Streptomyces sp. NPDC059070 TaxID=3346713 RepID=UPI0036C08A25
MNAAPATAGPDAGEISRAREIVFPRPLYSSVVAHAVRKFTGHYLDGETQERKAFGMLAGRPAGDSIQVGSVFPLIVNLRHDSGHRPRMDEVVEEHAIPSETPMDQRGWIADPRELMDIDDACDEAGWVLFGNYHTHRVPWPHDPARDTCTHLDRVLAAESGQWTFILSVVDLHRPVLRAFFEGDNEREATVRIVPPLPGMRRPGA